MIARAGSHTGRKDYPHIVAGENMLAGLSLFVDLTFPYRTCRQSADSRAIHESLANDSSGSQRRTNEHTKPNWGPHVEVEEAATQSRRDGREDLAKHMAVKRPSTGLVQ